MELAKTDICRYRSGLGGYKAGFVLSFETVKVFVGLEVRSIILANVLTLMISLLLFCVPEWVINICVSILNADFVSNPGLIYLDFRNSPHWYSYTKKLVEYQIKSMLCICQPKNRSKGMRTFSWNSYLVQENVRTPFSNI